MYKRTYILNLDGMLNSYIGVLGHQGNLTPNINNLIAQGRRYTKCYNIMPALTGSNHIAIMTSTHTGTHGILGVGAYYKGLDLNHQQLSPDYGLAGVDMYKHSHLQVQTFLNVIKSSNSSIKTAVIPGKFWVGDLLKDEACDILIYPGYTGNPSYVTVSEGYILGGEKHAGDSDTPPRLYIHKKNDPSLPPAGTIRIEPIDADIFPSDEWIVAHALKTIDNDAPDFMYLILANMDEAGHIYGSFLDSNVSHLNELRNPDAIKDQLYITDQAVANFVQGLKDRNLFDDSRLIITSDHGMSSIKTNAIMESGRSQKLYVDVRQILADNNIQMKANANRMVGGYKADGKYDWCMSEGPNCYIFNIIDQNTKNQIKQILLNYTITEDGQSINPVWRVLDAADQQNAINPYTNEKFKLYKGNFLDVIWPELVVFLKPHYLVPLYNDELASGVNPFMVYEQFVPPGWNINTAPGAHGTYSEQHVPLVIVDPEVPQGTISQKVSVLDIVSSINYLNRWPTVEFFEGRSLFIYFKPPVGHGFFWWIIYIFYSIIRFILEKCFGITVIIVRGKQSVSTRL